MTLILELTQNEEAWLREKAARQGQDASTYALSLVRQDIQAAPNQASEKTLAGHNGLFEHDGPDSHNRPATYDQNTATPPRTHSIMELEGLGADLWRNDQGDLIDAQEYVNDLRREWDGRP